MIDMVLATTIIQPKTMTRSMLLKTRDPKPAAVVGPE
jgi:hypothetical protein